MGTFKAYGNPMMVGSLISLGHIYQGNEIKKTSRNQKEISMSVMTIRLPQDKHDRLKQLADYRNISLNKLFEEMSTTMLSQFDIEICFRARAALGQREDGLALVAELDDFDKANDFTEKSYNQS